MRGHLLQQLEDRRAESDLEENWGSRETVYLNDARASRLDRSNRDLNTTSRLSVHDLCLDRVSRARRNSNKLHDLSVLLRNTIEPELAVVGGVDDGVVLD